VVGRGETLAFPGIKNVKTKIMFKRNLSTIFIAIAMILIILNHDFSAEINSKKFWMFLISLIVLVAAIIQIVNDGKSKKKN